MASDIHRISHRRSSFLWLILRLGCTIGATPVERQPPLLTDARRAPIGCPCRPSRAGGALLCSAGCASVRSSLCDRNRLGLGCGLGLCKLFRGALLHCLLEFCLGFLW